VLGCLRLSHDQQCPVRVKNGLGETSSVGICCKTESWLFTPPLAMEDHYKLAGRGKKTMRLRSRIERSTDTNSETPLQL
jgi:hypothetical protein